MPEPAVPEPAVPEPAVPDAATPGGDAVPDADELGADERAELERLRAEVANLRSQVAAAPGVAEPPPVVPPSRPRRQRWRSVVATLLIVIGCILAPLSVAAVWAKNLVTDTDRYVATVTPLASDPAIQNAVANKITTEIFARLDVQGITNQAVDALAERGLPPRVATRLHALSEPLASGVQTFVRDEVGKFVASDSFKDAWVTANRAAHQALVAAMTGQTGEGITIANDTVSINLGPFIQVVKQRLVDRGFELASRIPDINPSFTILQSDLITKAQGAFHLLNALGNWLPVVALILLALGVYVAKGHRRALLGAGLGLAGSMVVLALGIFFVRTIYLNALPLGVLDHEAAASFYDTLVRFLRLGLRTVLVLGLVVALGRIPHRHLGDRGPNPYGAEPRSRRAARRRRESGLPHRADLARGSTGTSACCSSRCLDRRACAGLLGSADWKGDHRPGTLRVGCAGDHRVPGTAADPNSPGAGGGGEPGRSCSLAFSSKSS